MFALFVRFLYDEHRGSFVVTTDNASEGELTTTATREGVVSPHEAVRMARDGQGRENVKGR